LPEDLSLGEAAAALGVSIDTLRSALMGDAR
jgi:hypothetical protein